VKQAFEFTARAEAERAYLIGISLPDLPLIRAHEHLDELERLAKTAGAVVVGKSVQGRTRIDGATFVGSGKAEEIKEICEELNVNLLIVDNDLSPAQARNLEKILKINVIDRTELILDIFARHASTQQSKIQVELAQLQYALPRLTRLWDHLSRQAGGIGLRGPGETQLEVDRRRIHTRMANLRRQLKKVETRRETLRRSRSGLPMIALIGYTNAGKSTLMRELTGDEVLVRDQLFATLDTTTRRYSMNGNGTALMVDTVGFIRKLPNHLVTSFKATLEDTAQADLYLHVVDASHPVYEEQMRVTDNTVRSIENPGVETIHVFNKIDQLHPQELESLRLRNPDAVFVSAQEGMGIDTLGERIESFFFGTNLRVEVKINAADGKNIAMIRGMLHDVQRRFDEDVCVLNGTIESEQMGRLESVSGAKIRYLM